MIARIRKFLSSLLNNLNAIGSLLLAFALANPSAAAELIALFPPEMRKGAVLGIPLLWFGLVQFAKARAIKKAKEAEDAKLRAGA